MATKGMSFYYDKDKIKLLKEKAKTEDRTFSGYIQAILYDHIISKESIFEPKKSKKNVTLKRRKTKK